MLTVGEQTAFVCSALVRGTNQLTWGAWELPATQHLFQDPMPLHTPTFHTHEPGWMGTTRSDMLFCFTLHDGWLSEGTSVPHCTYICPVWYWILLLGLSVTCRYQILKAKLERTWGQSSQLLSWCKLVWLHSRQRSWTSLRQPGPGPNM